MRLDICVSNIRVGIRVRGLHPVPESSILIAYQEDIVLKPRVLVQTRQLASGTPTNSSSSTLLVFDSGLIVQQMSKKVP